MLSCFAALGTYVPEKNIHFNRLTKAIREAYELIESSNIYHVVVMIERLLDKGWVFSYRNPAPLFTDDIIYCLYADRASNNAMVKYFRDGDFYFLHYIITNNGTFQLLQLSRDSL